MQYTEKDRAFFRKSPDIVAEKLLGKWICSKSGRFRIVETEAYFREDPECYGHDGKRTDATAPLFGQKGICCAFGGMLLITCGREGEPDNVLIRCAGNEATYCNGAWKVYNALWMKELSRAQDLLTSACIWIEDDGAIRDCCKTKRVRLKKEWKDKSLRFISL